MGNWVTISKAGASGYTPPPDAPNITSVAVQAYYGLFGNASAYGFGWATTPFLATITLPTADVNYAHLKEIDISALLPDGSTKPVATLYAPFVGSTVTFKSPCELLQTATSFSVVLTFTVKNDAGIATASPVTATVTVQASAVTGFTSAGEDTGTARFIIPANNDRLPYMTLQFVPILNGGQVPQTVSYGVSDDNGTSWTPIGWERINTVGQVVKFTRPVGAGTWKIYAAAGALDYSPAKIYSLPPGAVASSGFTVAALATPGASNGITATVGAFAYKQDGPEKTTYGYIPPIVYTDPTGTSTDFFVRVTVQDIDASHGLLGVENVHGGTQITGAGDPHVDNTQGLPITLGGQAGERFKIYVANKTSQGAGDFSNATTNKLQNVSWNGGAAADHFDVMFGTLPAGALNLRRAAQGSVSTPILAVDGLLNGNFEDTLTAGGLSTPRSWVCVNAAADTGFGGGIPYTGDKSLTFFPSAGTASAIAEDDYLIKPGQTYVLKGIAKTISANADLAIVVQYLDTTHTFISQDVTYLARATYSGAWGAIPTWSFTIPMGVGAAYCRFTLIFSTGTGNLLTAGYWSVDNLTADLQITTGPGTSPDGEGGSKAANTDSANLAANWRFDDAFLHWAVTGSTSISTTSDIGPKSAQLGGGSSVLTGDDIAVSPGQQLYFTARAALNTGGVLGTHFWGLKGKDNTGATIWTPTGTDTLDLTPMTAGSGFHTLAGVTYTVPASVVTVYPVFSTTLTGANIWLDAVYLRLQSPTGQGLAPDGKGGVQAALADGLTFVSGKVAPNLGSALQINPTTKLIEVANADISRFASSVRPIAIFTTNPALPDANYPNGTFGKNVTSGAFLRVNAAGNAWELAVNGAADVQAGTITADRINTASLAAAFATITYLTSNYITSTAIAASYATFSYLTSNYITSTAIAASYATFSYLTSTYATITTLTSTYATIASLTAKRIAADHIDAGTITIGSGVLVVQGSVGNTVTIDGPSGNLSCSHNIAVGAGNAYYVGSTRGYTGSLTVGTQTWTFSGGILVSVV